MQRYLIQLNTTVTADSPSDALNNLIERLNGIRNNTTADPRMITDIIPLVNSTDDDCYKGG